MTTWRHPTYMRRRLMRLMAEEQHREQQRQMHQQAAALLAHAQSLAALFGPPLAVGLGAALDNAAALVEVVDQASAPDGLFAELRKHLH